MTCNIQIELDANGDLFQKDSCSGISLLIGSISALISGASSQAYNSATGGLELTVSSVQLPVTPLFLGIETSQTPLGSASNPDTFPEKSLNNTRNLQSTIGLTPERLAVSGSWSHANQAWTFATLTTAANRVTYSASPLNAIAIATIPNPTATAGALPAGFKWVAFVSVLSVMNLQGSATGHSPIASFPMLKINGTTDQAENSGGGRIANNLYFHRSTGNYFSSQAINLSGVFNINQTATSAVTLDLDIFYKYTESVNIDPALVLFDAPRCKYLIIFKAVKV